MAQVFNEPNKRTESGIWQVGAFMPVQPPAHISRTPPHSPLSSKRAVVEPCRARRRQRQHCAGSVRLLGFPQQTAELCSGVRVFQQGRPSGCRTVFGFGWQRASLRSPCSLPPLQRAPIWPPAPRRWLLYAGPAVTAAAWCASPTENSAKPRCSTQAGVDTRNTQHTSSGGGADGARRALRPRPLGPPAW